jgi:hypothetical protein
MKQSVSTILILLLLVSQSLCAVPHSHAGTSVNEPDGHAARPHVHLHQAGHHDHHRDSHESHSTPDGQLPDHDSDAVYTADAQFLSESRAGEIAEPELSVDSLVYEAMCVVQASITNVILRNRHPVPVTSRPKCALFLQLLSIRC